MQFSSVIGQSAIKQRLVKSVADGRVSHTQMFLGPEGSGSLPLALAFAQYLNCENKQAEDSCGKCPSCLKSEKLIHPDIHYTYPVYKLKPSSENPALSTDFIKQWREAIQSNPYLGLNEWFDLIKLENKQSKNNISAEECRQIIHKFNMKTFESKHKVLILWMAEYLEREGNILLKLLEEPPKNSLLLLVAENQEQILPTILSRTQLLKILPLHDEDITRELVSRFSIDEKQGRHIARTAEGNFNEALRLMNNTENDNEHLLLQLFRFSSNNKVVDMNNFIDDLAKIGRENQKSFFRYGLGFLREVFVAGNLGNEQARLSDAEMKLAVFLNQRLGFEQKEQIVKQFNEAYYHIERNANSRILFLNLFITLSTLLRNNTVALPKV